MRNSRKQAGIIALAAALALTLSATGSAQYYYDPIQAQMAALNAQIDMWVAQQQAQINAMQQQHTAWFIKYYRDATGDYQTPDHLAFEYGINLYCQRNAAECAETHASNMALSANLHQARMNDINSWGQVNAGIAASNQSVLDGMFNGFMDRSAMTSQGQSNLIEGAVWGNGTFYNPSTGAAWQLPLYPTPGWTYTAPSGEPLAFDYQSNTWFMGTNWGWVPLQMGR